MAYHDRESRSPAASGAGPLPWWSPESVDPPARKTVFDAPPAALAPAIPKFANGGGASSTPAWVPVVAPGSDRRRRPSTRRARRRR